MRNNNIFFYKNGLALIKLDLTEPNCSSLELEYEFRRTTVFWPMTKAPSGKSLKTIMNKNAIKVKHKTAYTP